MTRACGSLAIIGLSAALALLATCGGKRSEPGLDSTFLVSWARHLGGAQRVFQAGHFVVGEWEPATQARPAPPTVASFTVDGQPGPSGPGWVLSPGRSANEVVVVRESDTALHYCVYRLSEPGGACRDIPAPDDAPWVFRAAECGSDTTKCLLVRWSRRAGAAAIRLALTVVDADALSAAATHVIEVEGGFYGTADTGGVALNPTQPTAYLLESASKDDPKYYVRAISLASGETQWRAELRQDLDKGGHVRLICAGSGQQVLVASGSTRYGLFSVHSMNVIDAATGTTRPIDVRLDDWRDVLLVRAADGDAVLRVKFSAVRGGLGESPDFDLAAVDQITMSGRLSSLWTARVRPGEAPTSRLASAALSIGKSTLLLAPASGIVVRDPASSTTQEERRRLVEGLIRY